MSAGGAFGGNRGARPVPPEKGVFPLDHLHECDLEKKEYITCLKSSGHLSEKCRQFSKKYLECRMEKNLMAKQDMTELGFGRGLELDSSEKSYADIERLYAVEVRISTKLGLDVNLRFYSQIKISITPNVF